MIEMAFAIHELRGAHPRVRPARMADLDRIEEIYDEIHGEIEAGRASIGWIRGVYPTRQTAEASIGRGEMFVLEDGGVIAAAGRINQVQGPEYDGATWSFDAAPDQVMVLHTLVVSPKMSGRGFGREFVAFYEDYARKRGCSALRMDTNAINAAARALYQKLGYRECCIVATDFNGIPDIQLVCMDKRL